MTRGALYYAVGDEYVEQARRSAESLKRHMPDMAITIATDQADVPDVFDTVLDVEPGDAHPFLDRIQHLSRTEYDEVLYLDTDTYVTDDVSDLFDLLDRFDFAAAFDPVRHRTPMDGMPSSFAEFNAGVMVYRNTEEVHAVFDRYEELYEELLAEHGHIIDQPALAKAVYESDLDICHLPDEYNCRFFGPTYVEGEVKILHGTHPDMAAMAEAVNRETGKRVLTGHSDRRIFAEPKPMRVIQYPGPGKWRIYADRVVRSLREDGLWETLTLVAQRLPRLYR